MRGVLTAVAALAISACATTDAGTVTMEDMPMKSASGQGASGQGESGQTVDGKDMARTMDLKMHNVTMETTAPDRIAMNAVIERATGKSLRVPRTAFRDDSVLTLQEPGAPGRDMRMPGDVVSHSFRLITTGSGGDAGCALVYETTGEVFPLEGVSCG